MKINKMKFLGSSCLRGGNKGFTLMELVVAIGIMAMVIFFAGTVFKASIGSYRIASAQAEIMQKFRAVTDQLNNDFRGLRKDAPMFIWFHRNPMELNDPNRFDQIMFFADGDFQSVQTYSTYIGPLIYNGYIIPQPSGSPVVSNLARIYYGQAKSIDPQNNIMKYPVSLRPVDRVLSRRQYLSTANPNYWQFPLNSGGVLNLDPNTNNDWLEHDTNSLSQWQAAANDPTNGSTNVSNIITHYFGNDLAFSDNRPQINLSNADTLHLLMTQKVGSFSVQWSYFYKDVLTGLTHIYWWPSIDPDGNGDFTDNDFGKMPVAPFGFYFNTAAPSFTNWFSYDKAGYLPGAVTEPGYPRALKFTFTLYDSKNVFKDGQTFTHIVYLGD